MEIGLISVVILKTGAGVTITDSPSGVGFTHLMELSNLMGCMISRQPLPAALAG